MINLKVTRRCVAALGMTVVVACGGATPKDLSTEFRETPLRHLRGVELGMTGKRLRALRPAAKYEPYGGFTERIPGYWVTYQSRALDDSHGPNAGDSEKVEAIIISQPFVSKSDAEQAWREKVREIGAAKRPPDSCESFDAGGLQARWFTGDIVLAVGAFPREPMAPTVGDRVIFAISHIATMKQPSGARKIACPAS